MQLNNEEKMIQLMTEIKDLLRKHDRGVRPTVLALLGLLVIMILVTYFK